MKWLILILVVLTYKIALVLLLVDLIRVMFTEENKEDESYFFIYLDAVEKIARELCIQFI